MSLRWFACCALLAVAAPQMASAEAVQLQRKYEPGRQTTSVSETKIKQTLALAGQNIETTSSQTVKTSTKVLDKTADGGFKVQHKIEQVKGRLGLPGGIEMEIDSANPDAAKKGTQFDAITDMFKALHGATWVATHGKDQRVTNVEGSEKALENLDPSLQAMIKDQLDKDNLKQSLNLELDRYPAKPVNQGDSWQLTEPVKLGQGQKMTFKTTYTYQGPVEKNGQKLDQLTLKHTDVEYDLDPTGGLPLKLVKSNLKITESSGEILFDRQKGQEVSSTDKFRVQGELVFEVGGMQLPGTLDLTIEKSNAMK